MGWAIASAFSSKGCSRATPTNYLEIFVSSGNKEAITQIEKFLKYLDQNVGGIFRNVRYANIKNIQIRYFNRAGKMNILYVGNELSEDKFENIKSQIR